MRIPVETSLYTYKLASMYVCCTYYRCPLYSVVHSVYVAQTVVCIMVYTYILAYITIYILVCTSKCYDIYSSMYK